MRLSEAKGARKRRKKGAEPEISPYSGFSQESSRVGWLRGYNSG